MKLGVWQFAALFAMAMLGATHLTGYEWMRFFTYYGSWGTVGLIVSVISMTWLAKYISQLVYIHKIESATEFFSRIVGQTLGPSFTLLFFASSAGYIAHIFSLEVNRASQWIQLPVLGAPLLLGVMIYLLLNLNLQRMSTLIFGCLLVCAGYFVLLLLKQRHIELPSLAYQSNIWWIIQALFFISCHIIMSLILLLPSIQLVPTHSQLNRGIWLGGGIFAIIALLCHSVLLTYWHDVNSSAEPFAIISSTLFTGSSLVYSMMCMAYSVLFIGIWTLLLTKMLVDRFDLRHQPVRLLCLFLMICLSILYSSITLLGTLTQVACAYVGLVFLLFLIRHMKRA